MSNITPKPSVFRRVDEHILCPDTRSVIVDCLYSLFALFVLFQHIHIIIYSNTYPGIWTTFNKTKVIFAVISIFLGKMWKDKGFWILLLLFLVKLFRLSLGYSYESVSDTWRTILYRGSYAFFGCYAIGRVLSGKRLKAFIITFCSLWTAAMVIYSVLGIHVVWTGKPIANLGNKSIDVIEARLNPVLYCVEAGILAAASISFLFILISLTKPKALKALEILAIPVIFLFGALTVTRTNYVMLGVELASLVCVAIYKRLHEKYAAKKTVFTWMGKWAVLAVVFLSISLSAVLVQTRVIGWFNSVRDKGLITEASAESTDDDDDKEMEVAAREFRTANANAFFTGRIGIWESIINTTIDKPIVLLWGESAEGCMRSVDEYREKHRMFKAYHVHNEYLQITLENGIVGLALFLAFTFYCLRHGLKLLWATELPMWQRVVPITMMACLIAELVDCTCYVNNGHPQMTLLYVTAGLTTALGQIREKNRTNGP